MKRNGTKTNSAILTTCFIVLCCITNTVWADSSQYLCQDSGDSSCTGITMAIGPCGTQNWTNTITYSVGNGTSAQEVFSVDNKNAGAVTKYMKQGVLWKVDMENDHFNQKLTTYIKITPSGWEYANGCNKTSLEPGCEAAMLFPPPGMNLSPGCQMTKYTPPPPPPPPTAKCGDNTKTTTWKKRITIHNNCMDSAYVVLTPPTAGDKQHYYNAYLWNKTAEKAGMEEMYANPQNRTSALLFRKMITFGESMDIPVPDGGIASANFGVLLGCDTPPSGVGWPGDCVIGGVPGMASSGVGTVFEYSAGCAYTGADRTKCTVNPSDGTCMGATDYFDLSMVSGFNVPMSMEITDNGNDCNFTEMYAVADLYDCPKEDQTTIAGNSTLYTNKQLNAGIGLQVSNNNRGRAGCMAPEQWLEPPGGQDPYKNTDTTAASGGITTSPPNISDWYACNVMKAKGADKDPQTCLTPGCGGPQCAVGPLGTPGQYDMVSLSKGKGKPYTNYVKYLKAVGSDAYAWQFNDDASTAICQKAGATIKVTLCPGPSEQQPYKKQKWSFSNNKCQADPANGSYPTLLACMKANFDYSCQPEEVKKLNAKTGEAVTAQLNYCKPVPKGQGVPYDVCTKNNSQYCQQTGKTPPNTEKVKKPNKPQ
ncbi:hypothetical protein [Desulfovibrio sp. JC022]|uniref:hypothetical protein n=1 Tax=Desulfovibrio sp. JC022 TaxID=2593642 RepID=UPI0013D55588|nr:hypothetical protein [Desulfovibrio sp. JC022]NDV22267.1 hypothetical protein [Desulfovibrio sp. JC022]